MNVERGDRLVGRKQTHVLLIRRENDESPPVLSSSEKSASRFIFIIFLL